MFCLDDIQDAVMEHGPENNLLPDDPPQEATTENVVEADIEMNEDKEEAPQNEPPEEDGMMEQEENHQLQRSKSEILSQNKLENLSNLNDQSQKEIPNTPPYHDNDFSDEDDSHRKKKNVTINTDHNQIAMYSKDSPSNQQIKMSNSRSVLPLSRDDSIFIGTPKLQNIPLDLPMCPKSEVTMNEDGDWNAQSSMNIKVDYERQGEEFMTIHQSNGQELGTTRSVKVTITGPGNRSQSILNCFTLNVALKNLFKEWKTQYDLIGIPISFGIVITEFLATGPIINDGDTIQRGIHVLSSLFRDYICSIWNGKPFCGAMGLTEEWPLCIQSELWRTQAIKNQTMNYIKSTHPVDEVRIWFHKATPALLSLIHFCCSHPFPDDQKPQNDKTQWNVSAICAWSLAVGIYHLCEDTWWDLINWLKANHLEYIINGIFMVEYFYLYTNHSNHLLAELGRYYNELANNICDALAYHRSEHDLSNQATRLSHAKELWEKTQDSAKWNECVNRAHTRNESRKLYEKKRGRNEFEGTEDEKDGTDNESTITRPNHSTTSISSTTSQSSLYSLRNEFQGIELAANDPLILISKEETIRLGTLGDFYCWLHSKSKSTMRQWNEEEYAQLTVVRWLKDAIFGISKDNGYWLLYVLIDRNPIENWQRFMLTYSKHTGGSPSAVDIDAAIKFIRVELMPQYQKYRRSFMDQDYISTTLFLNMNKLIKTFRPDTVSEFVVHFDWDSISHYFKQSQFGAFVVSIPFISDRLRCWIFSPWSTIVQLLHLSWSGKIGGSESILRENYRGDFHRREIEAKVFPVIATGLHNLLRSRSESFVPPHEWSPMWAHILAESERFQYEVKQQYASVAITPTKKRRKRNAHDEILNIIDSEVSLIQSTPMNPKPARDVIEDIPSDEDDVMMNENENQMLEDENENGMLENEVANETTNSLQVEPTDSVAVEHSNSLESTASQNVVENENTNSSQIQEVKASEEHPPNPVNIPVGQPAEQPFPENSLSKLYFMRTNEKCMRLTVPKGIRKPDKRPTVFKRERNQNDSPGAEIKGIDNVLSISDWAPEHMAEFAKYAQIVYFEPRSQDDDEKDELARTRAHHFSWTICNDINTTEFIAISERIDNFKATFSDKGKKKTKSNKRVKSKKSVSKKKTGKGWSGKAEMNYIVGAFYNYMILENLTGSDNLMKDIRMKGFWWNNPYVGLIRTYEANIWGSYVRFDGKGTLNSKTSCGSDEVAAVFYHIIANEIAYAVTEKYSDLEYVIFELNKTLIKKRKLDEDILDYFGCYQCYVGVGHTGTGHCYCELCPILSFDKTFRQKLSAKGDVIKPTASAAHRTIHYDVHGKTPWKGRTTGIKDPKDPTGTNNLPQKGFVELSTYGTIFKLLLHRKNINWDQVDQMTAEVIQEVLPCDPHDFSWNKGRYIGPIDTEDGWNHKSGGTSKKRRSKKKNRNKNKEECTVEEEEEEEEEDAKGVTGYMHTADVMKKHPFTEKKPNDSLEKLMLKIARYCTSHDNTLLFFRKLNGRDVPSECNKRRRIQMKWEKRKRIQNVMSRKDMIYFLSKYYWPRLFEIIKEIRVILRVDTLYEPFPELTKNSKNYTAVRRQHNDEDDDSNDSRERKEKSDDDDRESGDDDSEESSEDDDSDDDDDQGGGAQSDNILDLSMEPSNRNKDMHHKEIKLECRKFNLLDEATFDFDGSTLYALVKQHREYTKCPFWEDKGRFSMLRYEKKYNDQFGWPWFLIGQSYCCEGDPEGGWRTNLRTDKIGKIRFLEKPKTEADSRIFQGIISMFISFLLFFANFVSLKWNVCFSRGNRSCRQHRQYFGNNDWCHLYLHQSI